MTLARGLSLLLLTAFVVMLVAAALAYPGGSWDDPAATRFHWLWNYWCDLIREQAWNGAPNGTARMLAQASFIALALSLASYWHGVAPLLCERRLARTVVAAGWVTTLGVVLVALLPHDEFTRWHALGTVTAGGFGLLSTALLLWGSVSIGPLVCWRHVWGAALVLGALVNLFAYVDAAFLRPRDGPLLPCVQKAATPLLVLWMVATLRDARAAARASRCATRPP